MSVEDLNKIAKYSTAKGPFSAFVEAVNYAHNLVEKSTQLFKLHELAISLKISVVANKVTKPVIALDKMEAEVYNKYMMLSMIQIGYDGLGIKQLGAIGEYIDSIK